MHITRAVAGLCHALLLISFSMLLFQRRVVHLSFITGKPRCRQNGGGLPKRVMVFLDSRRSALTDKMVKATKKSSNTFGLLRTAGHFGRDALQDLLTSSRKPFRHNPGRFTDGARSIHGANDSLEGWWCA